jgi:CRP-like cAMP-binding protein
MTGRQHRVAPSAGDIARALDALGLPASAWETVELAPGQTLFAAGDSADAFYVVAAGEVEAFLADTEGRTVSLERLGAGASFGELALLDGGERTTGVRALTASTLAVLRRPAFHAALQRSPEMAVALLEVVGARLRRNLRHLDYLIAWAGLVADGRYEEAQRAIAREAETAGDDTGRFVATFTAMVASVRARETALTAAVDALRVEIDQVRRAHHVAELTETEFFRSLQDQARRLRAASGAPDG